MNVASAMSFVWDTKPDFPSTTSSNIETTHDVCKWLQNPWCKDAIAVGKTSFVSHTKHTAKATNMDLFHS